MARDPSKPERRKRSILKKPTPLKKSNLEAIAEEVEPPPSVSVNKWLASMCDESPCDALRNRRASRIRAPRRAVSSSLRSSYAPSQYETRAATNALPRIPTQPIPLNFPASASPDSPWSSNSDVDANLAYALSQRQIQLDETVKRCSEAGIFVNKDLYNLDRALDVCQWCSDVLVSVEHQSQEYQWLMSQYKLGSKRCAPTQEQICSAHQRDASFPVPLKDERRIWKVARGRNILPRLQSLAPLEFLHEILGNADESVWYRLCDQRLSWNPGEERFTHGYYGSSAFQQILDYVITKLPLQDIFSYLIGTKFVSCGKYVNGWTSLLVCQNILSEEILVKLVQDDYPDIDEQQAVTILLRTQHEGYGFLDTPGRESSPFAHVTPKELSLGRGNSLQARAFLAAPTDSFQPEADTQPALEDRPLKLFATPNRQEMAGPPAPAGNDGPHQRRLFFAPTSIRTYEQERESSQRALGYVDEATRAKAPEGSGFKLFFSSSRIRTVEQEKAASDKALGYRIGR